MDHLLRLENLPRTIELVRTGDGAAELAYVDQRRLPGELAFVRTGDWRCVVDAVKTLAVRGAPAIGVAGAAAVALWAGGVGAPRACAQLSATELAVLAVGGVGAPRACAQGCVEEAGHFLEGLASVAEQVASARPTAVNLAWGVRQAAGHARALVAEGMRPWQVADELYDLVKRMEAEDEAANRAIGSHGAALLPGRARILTHCNAGSLATVFYGTALGVVYAAAGQGKVERVYADETRPVGQGARLTAWELAAAGVPCTLVCDDMAASLMAKGRVDAVVVGADRIAANGDVANKIGTYGLAVLAHHHGIPFYVAAPASTVDAACATGADIPIEERDPAEVLPRPIEGVDVWNPAFDVTPADLVTRVITEQGTCPPSEVARCVQEVTRMCQ